jgi:hypothetical protein
MSLSENVRENHVNKKMDFPFLCLRDFLRHSHLKIKVNLPFYKITSYEIEKSTAWGY